MIGHFVKRLREVFLRTVVYRGSRGPEAFEHVGPVRIHGDDNAVSHIFRDHEGRQIHKWLHFPRLYDRHFTPLQGKPVRLLEIGVRAGGSLEIWRRLFGPDAVIVGIDIDPTVAGHVTPPNHICIGDQGDRGFLDRIVAEFGPFDIVIDDGSHVGSDQRISLIALFPHLRDGGVYVIEDTMTSYLAGAYRGGLRRRGTAMEVVKDLIDDMHAWVHGRGTRTKLAGIGSVHVYPTIVFIEKAEVATYSHGRFGGHEPNLTCA